MLNFIVCDLSVKSTNWILFDSLFGAPKKLSYFGRFIFAPSRRQLLKILLSSIEIALRENESQSVRKRKIKRENCSSYTQKPSSSVSMYVCVQWMCTCTGFACTKNSNPCNIDSEWRVCMRECTRCEFFPYFTSNLVILCCFWYDSLKKLPPKTNTRILHTCTHAHTRIASAPLY